VPQGVHERAGGAAVTDAGCPQGHLDQLLQSAAPKRLAQAVDDREPGSAAGEITADYVVQRVLDRHRPGLAAVADDVNAALAGRVGHRADREGEQLGGAQAAEQQGSQDARSRSGQGAIAAQPDLWPLSS
jgi:hypothetical protein